VLLLCNQAISETLVTADYVGSGWDDGDPSVFKMTIVNPNAIRGEYQLTNGYGPDRAPQVLQVKVIIHSINKRTEVCAWLLAF